jgi:hypothetical protein
MFRATCAVLGFVALVAPAPPDVDAVAFAKAFQSGQADQFKNKQVSGTGVSFHGPITERVADGSTRTSLVVTLGAVGADGRLTPLTSWDEFVAAERTRTTLVVALSGPKLPDVPAGAHDHASAPGGGRGRRRRDGAVPGRRGARRRVEGGIPLRAAPDGRDRDDRAAITRRRGIMRGL